MADSGVGGRNSAHAQRVLLYWWMSNCRTRQRGHATHWGFEPPRPQLAVFECLGTLNHRSNIFSVEGVTCQQTLPPMVSEEEQYLLAVLRHHLAVQTGWRVKGLRRDVVDWASDDLDD